MWISRKKYNELIKELESLRVYAQIFDDYLKNGIEVEEDCNYNYKELLEEKETECQQLRDELINLNHREY